MAFAVDIILVSRLNEGVGIFDLCGLCGMAIGPMLGEFVHEGYGEVIFSSVLQPLHSVLFCYRHRCMKELNRPHQPAPVSQHFYRCC